MRKSRDVSTYSGAHRRLTLTRGKATLYACECGQPAAEWAYDYTRPAEDERIQRGMKFSADPMAYKPMCRRCHRLFDKSLITHCPQGHAYEGTNVLMDAGKRKCRECHYARGRARPRHVTAEAKARRNEYQRAYRARLKGDAA